MQHTFTLGWQSSGGGSPIQSSVVIAGEEEINLDEPVPVSTTNQQYAFAFAQAKLQGIILVSDKALTLKFNSTGSPAPLITLAPNVPVVWFVGNGLVNPFAGADVTTLYVTNASGSNIANLKIRALINAH